MCSKKLYQSDVLSYYDENGNYDVNEVINPEGKFYFPAKYVVCYECNGHGTHFRRDLDENALYESMVEDGDEDGIESYYGGSFDEVCRSCHGKRVVYEYEFPEWARKVLDDYYQWMREDKYMREQERRVGA
jgi:hypothetical protein